MKKMVINHVMLCPIYNKSYLPQSYFLQRDYPPQERLLLQRKEASIFTLFFILINLEIILLLHQSALCGEPFIANTHLQLRFCQYGIWTTTSKEMTSDEFVNGIYLGRVCSWTCRLGDNRIGMINDTNIRRW